jgi:hypothetical protein
MYMEVLVVNVATAPRNPDRPVTPESFDPGTGKESAAHNIHPADLGCVDWYLYPVNRKPNFPSNETRYRSHAGVA